MAATSLNARTTATDALDGSALMKVKGGFYTGILTGTTALNGTYPAVCKLDPGGAHRDVTLDAIATNEGLFRKIVNAADAAENLVCKNVAGDTIATINQNEEGEFFCDGTSWYLVRIATIALS